MTRGPALAPLQLGWPLMPDPGDGTLGYPDLGQSVRDQIRIILMTRPGEMLLHPSFGAGIEDLLHEPNSLTTRRRLRDLVSASLGRWEPRIALDAVEVWEVAGRADALRIEIAYRLRRTGAAAQLHIDLALGS